MGVSCVCYDCAKDVYLKKYITNNKNNKRRKCTFCGKVKNAVQADDELVQVFRILLRYHYAETDYNSHGGGNGISSLLSIDNPIVDTSKLEQGDTIFDDIEFDFFDSDNAYDGNICVYVGGDRGNFHFVSLKQENSYKFNLLKEEVLLKNYFELEDEQIAKIKDYIGKFSITIPSGENFYRARKGGEEKQKTFFRDIDRSMKKQIIPFKGSSISAPPTKLVGSGRINRQYLSYLYLASDINTCICEVRPHPGERVSVGKFKINSDLKVVDLRDINPLKFIDFKDGDMHFSFFNSLAKEFSTPVEPENGYKYIVTQVISDIFREMGFDGVLFNSSVGNGYNLVVFYTGKCSYVADSSKLYLIPKVKYDIFEMKYRFKKEHLFDFEPDVDLIPVENELVMSCPVGYMLSTN